jgi:hypothetical protein
MSGRNSHRPQFNDHHFWWNRREFVLQQATRRMRENPGSIIHGLHIAVHNRLHDEIGPIKPPSQLLANIALNHILAINVNDGREGALLQADYLWKIAQQDSELGDEAYKYAQHLEWQIDFLELGKEAA